VQGIAEIQREGSFHDGASLGSEFTATKDGADKKGVPGC
jgi:hypothetical protein